ncbi:hypothetical protein ACVCIC_14285 [Burkholderia glumae]|uniref:Uncharacterized protein n=1 Tax=Burkholderia glumae TaxID=337 RepID=A0ABY5BC77_BURGL|nr:hypothetical protein [Burkholderia glumae]MCM2483873.1 hypothetical protein [Burkholderia glumae]MCM2509567.1 hypothetical protein [Burkholderia glumae]USS43236.1 hypothetical protein NFI99_01750 [Burkholderia glumae]
MNISFHARRQTSCGMKIRAVALPPRLSFSPISFCASLVGPRPAFASIIGPQARQESCRRRLAADIEPERPISRGAAWLRRPAPETFNGREPVTR